MKRRASASKAEKMTLQFAKHRYGSLVVLTMLLFGALSPTRAAGSSAASTNAAGSSAEGSCAAADRWPLLQYAAPPSLMAAAKEFDASNYEIALQLLIQISQLQDPYENAKLHYFRGLCLQALGRFKQSAREYKWVANHWRDPVFRAKAQAGKQAATERKTKISAYQMMNPFEVFAPPPEAPKAKFALGMHSDVSTHRKAVPPLNPIFYGQPDQGFQIFAGRSYSNALKPIGDASTRAMLESKLEELTQLDAPAKNKAAALCMLAELDERDSSKNSIKKRFSETHANATSQKPGSALTGNASSLHNNADLKAQEAEEKFLRAVKLLQTEKDNQAEAVKALIGLAGAYRRDGKYYLETKTFDQALALAQTIEGQFPASAIEVLEAQLKFSGDSAYVRASLLSKLGSFSATDTRFPLLRAEGYLLCVHGHPWTPLFDEDAANLLKAYDLYKQAKAPVPVVMVLCEIIEREKAFRGFEPDGEFRRTAVASMRKRLLDAIAFSMENLDLKDMDAAFQSQQFTGLINAYVTLAEPSDARELVLVYRDLVKKFPRRTDSSEAYCSALLARIDTRLGHFAEAEREYKDAIQLFANISRTEDQMKGRVWDPIPDPSPSFDTANPASYWQNDAELYDLPEFHVSQYTDANEFLRQEQNARMGLGVLYSKENKFDLASAEFADQKSKLFRTRGATIFATILADHFFAAGRITEAQESYRKALKGYGLCVSAPFPEVRPLRISGGIALGLWGGDAVVGAIPGKSDAIKAYIESLKQHPMPDSKEAISYFEKVLLTQEDTSQEAIARNQIMMDIHKENGAILNLGPNPLNEITAFRTEIDERKALHDSDQKLSDSLNVIGHELLIRGLYADAEKFLKEAIEIREKHGLQAEAVLGQSLANLGRLYMEQGRLEAAEPLLLRAIELRKKDRSDKLAWAYAQIYLGRLYVLTGRFEQAKLMLTETNAALAPKFSDRINAELKISASPKTSSNKQLARQSGDHGITPGILKSITNKYYSSSLLEYAGLFMAQRKFNQAAATLAQALDCYTKPLPDQIRIGPRLYLAIAECDIARKKYSAASKMLNEARILAVAELNPKHPVVGEITAQKECLKRLFDGL
jgi:hypothetical protein